MDTVAEIIAPQQLPIVPANDMEWVSFSLNSVMFVKYRTRFRGKPCRPKTCVYQWDGRNFQLLPAIPDELKAELMLNVMQN